jgi:putative FmdB family regulatory protein
MPIYEYTCSKCHKLSDVLQKLSDPPPEHCPACGAEGSLTRVVSRTSFVLKGGGWGADLYGSPKKASEPASSPGSEAGTPAGAPATTASPAGAPGPAAPSSGSSGAASTPAAAGPKSDKTGSDS